MEDELAQLRSRLEHLERQKAEDESSFGQKRAQFMDLYSKKEGKDWLPASEFDLTPTIVLLIL